MHFAGRNALLEMVQAGWCMLWQDDHGSEDTLPQTEGYLASFRPYYCWSKESTHATGDWWAHCSYMPLRRVWSEIAGVAVGSFCSEISSAPFVYIHSLPMYIQYRLISNHSNSLPARHSTRIVCLSAPNRAHECGFMQNPHYTVFKKSIQNP